MLGLLVPLQRDEVRLCNNFLAARTEKNWTLDRLSNKNLVSVAATGVGFFAYAKAEKLGLIPAETASKWIRDGFDNMLLANKENDGWIYHFLDLSGKPYRDSEVSSIDSAIFYASAERAATLLGDETLLKHILTCKGKISQAVMLDDEYFYHGWIIEDGKRKYLRSKWKHYDEGILLYKYFNRPFKPLSLTYDKPLFVYYYPLAFYPDERQWIDNLGKAIDFQIKTAGRLGYTACDSFSGYSVNSPYVISPLSIFSCRRYFPSICDEQLKKISVDPLLQSISVDGSWKSKDRVLLDDGILLLLEEK